VSGPRESLGASKIGVGSEPWWVPVSAYLVAGLIIAVVVLVTT
jgi:hypothetical protein